MTARELDWTRLGRELRESTEDCFRGSDFGVPPPDEAYEFLLENPEAFGYDEWPPDMPHEANIELIAAYCFARPRP